MLPAADRASSECPGSHTSHRRWVWTARSRCGPARSEGCSYSYPAAARPPEFLSASSLYEHNNIKLCRYNPETLACDGKSKANLFHILFCMCWNKLQDYFKLLKCVFPPGSDEIQEVLPAVADFVEFLFDFRRLALVTGSGQAFSQPVQLQLVLFSHSDLLLVVLRHNATQLDV